MSTAVEPTSRVTPDESRAPQLSICIVAYKRKDLLAQCLEAVRFTVRNCSYEILVCDNASADGTVEVIGANYPDVRLVVNETNRGFAAANNQLIQMSRGEFILLLNNDCLVTEGAVDALVAFLLRHPEAAIVGSRILLPDGILQPSFLRTLESPLANYTWTRFTRAKRQEKCLATAPESARKRKVSEDYAREQSYDRTQEAAIVSGTCLLARRAFINECGALDERYFMYSEDWDWCLRAQRAGWKVFYCHESTAYHHYLHRAARDPEFARIIEPAYYRSQLIFCRTHFGLTKTLLLAFLLALVALARMGKALLLLPWSAGRSRWLEMVRNQIELLTLLADSATGISPQQSLSRTTK